MKRPSFQFYVKDWLGDFTLRGCSSAARGLWIDMMCLMHQGSPYGHLRSRVSNGGYSIPDNAKLAKMTGNNLDEIEKWIGELKESGVLGVSKNGVLFSKKMQRDERVRSQWRARQNRARKAKIAVKPKKTKEKSERDVTHVVTPVSRLSSSSSSSATTKKEEEKKLPSRRRPKGPPTLDTLPKKWEPWYLEITWTPDGVQLTDAAWEGLAERIRDIAEVERLPLFSDEEIASSLSRMKGYFLDPTAGQRRRSPWSLPAIVVSWFEKDLRYAARLTRARRKLSPEEREGEAWQKVAEEAGV